MSNLLLACLAIRLGNLEWADVMIWWGHVRQNEVIAEKATRILDYIKCGALDLIALHSAHWARPSVEAMNWRSIDDDRNHFEEHANRGQVTIQTIDTVQGRQRRPWLKR